MRMTLAGVSALLLFCIDAHAMSADELVPKNIQGRGGADKIEAIKDLMMEGRRRGGGTFELTYVKYEKAPYLTRFDATVQGLTQVQAWDGHSAWRISPF